jgi:xanthine dehydrogenase accessory factor
MNPEIESRAAELRQERVPFVHARVVRAERPTSAKPGDQAVVLPDGSIEGFVGGVCAESTVRAQSLYLLDSGAPLLLRISPDGAGDGSGGGDGNDDEGEERDGAGSTTSGGALTVVNPCLSGGTLEIFLEPVIPAPALVVKGESPIAAALVALAEGVGFQVAEGAGTDHTTGGGYDAASAVVVASHGRDEEGVLEEAVRAGVPYVGLVASRKRAAAVIAGLDLDEAQKAMVHSPAGLDIGARTPREVALSILAEIVSLRPRPSGLTAAPIGAADAAPSPDATPDAPAAGEAGAFEPVTFVRPGERPPVATDLVCGMSVVADEAALHLDHEGTRYWFCGSGCLRAFAADPSTYVPGLA